MYSKKRMTSWLLTFCLIFSIFTGIGPLQMAWAAETEVSVTPIATNFNYEYTTSAACWVSIAGSFNDWNATDEKTKMSYDNAAGKWTKSLNISDYEKLKDCSNEFKFVVHIAGQEPIWQGESNQVVYRDAFLLGSESVSVIKGNTIKLPNGVYYSNDQVKKEVDSKDIKYSINPESPGVSLTEGQITANLDCNQTSITLMAEYEGQKDTLTVNILSAEVKSPIINKDGTVTINAVYNGATLYYVGSMTSWDANQVEMTKTDWGFTYTTKEPVAPGSYQYKFKPNKDNWDGNFTDSKNTNPLVGGNSVIYISGLAPINISAQAGKVTELPITGVFYDEKGISQAVNVTYSLLPAVEGVSLDGNKLSIAENCLASSLTLTASDSEHGVTGKVNVNIVSDLYTYTIHYFRPATDYDKWELWLWVDGKDGATKTFDTELVEGYKTVTCQFPAQKLNFIVKQENWASKDIGEQRSITAQTGQKAVDVWLVQGDPTIYYQKPELGARVINAFADRADEIIFNTNKTITDVKDFILKDDKNNIIPTTGIKLGDKQGKLTITGDEQLIANKLYIVSNPTYKEACVTMRSILDDPTYYYEGDDLGYTYLPSSTTFKLWAPTASRVEIITRSTSYEMTLSEGGVWEITCNGNYDGATYCYNISFPDGTVNKNVVDPYARALTANSQESVVVDLNSTDPSGFDGAAGPQINSPTDAVVYEMHIRDFSIDDNSNFQQPGTYLALTETGLKTPEGNAIGIDHLKALGITHVQLQPVYDYGTVDETAVSPEPQDNNYNWGYDPQNYNVPEGSYATKPSDPKCRINEFKQMVDALHQNGIGVIMDVVYNHTYNVNTQCFNKVVPGYYYRMDDEGNYTDGAGCNNEIASERPMVRKYIQDSTEYWAQEYGIDGFRFDLMALIDTETVKQVTTHLKKEVNPNILVYGEPWTGGSSGLSSELQTGKGKQKGYEFGIFNDNIRSAIKGDSDGSGKGFATGATGQEANIVEGVMGSINTIAENPTEMVNYITAHDNLNLWDKVLTTMGKDCKAPYASLTEVNLLENEAVKRSLLANGIVFTSQGLNFIYEGDEMLRTKYGDHNSYKSSDDVNRIAWNNLDQYKAVSDYYAGLITLRKAHPAFRMNTASEVKNNFKAYVQADQVVAYTLQNHANGDNWENIVVIYNANTTSKKVALPHQGDWNIVVNDKKAGTSALSQLTATSEVELAPLSMMVLYDNALNYEPVPSKLVLESNELGMAVGNNKLLKVTVKDQNGASMTGVKLSFESSDDKVISADSNGKLVAKSVGEARITISHQMLTTYVDVKVVNQLIPSKIEIAFKDNYVYEGYSVQATTKVYDQFDQEILNPTVAWSSDNKACATVDSNGKVKGISAGQVTISAKAGEEIASLRLLVKSYESRYIVFEYIRPDQDYTDWNIWVWNSGVNDGQVNFTEFKEGKAIAYIKIGPDAEGLGFLLRKGTDWSTAKQDISTDRTIYTTKDQIITKARVTSMVNEMEVLESYTAPVVDIEHDCIHFSYRDTEYFKRGMMNELTGVKIQINGKLYDMTYDEKNELFKYDYKGLESGKYYYCYKVTYADGSEGTYLDSQNNNQENDLSVIEYKKLDLELTATVNPGSFNFREGAVLSVGITSKTEKAIDSKIKSIVADLSELGMASAVNIDPYLKQITLSTTSETVPGVKDIKVKVYDIYGNVYKVAANVVVESQESVKKDGFDWDEAVIYFAITDRFYNGDTANDDPVSNNYSKKDPGAYHGGDLKGITNKLDYLKSLGINTIWISPIVDQVDQNVLWDDDTYQNTNKTYYAYHGYWAKNFEKLNPHLGTLDDLHELIDEAHERNMKLMVDVVINHAGYGTKEGESATEKNYPTDEDRARFTGMLRTDGSTDSVYGELAGLPDFITEKPEVREKIIDWQTNWVENLAVTPKGNTIDYFRIDTAKHVDQVTLQAFKTALAKVKPNFKFISEAWLSGSDLDAYLNRGMTDSVLNFDFNEVAKQFAIGNVSTAEAYFKTLNDKATSAATYGNFLGSHDEDGFLYLLGMKNIDQLMLAASLQATSKGQPVIYYGEELGQSGANNWPFYDNRYDFDWKIANSENTILNHYQKVFNIRKQYSELFARGTREQLAGSDALGYLAFSRSYKGKTLINILNTKDISQTVIVTVPYKVGSKVKDLYSGTTYDVGKAGNVVVTVPASKAGGTVILTQIEGGNSDSSSSNDSSSPNSGSTNKGGSSKADQKLDDKSVEITTSEMRADAKEKKDIIVKIHNVSLQVSYEALLSKLSDQASSVVIEVSEVKAPGTESKDYQLAGGIYSINISSMVNGKKVNLTTVDGPITVKLSLTDEMKASIGDLRKIGIYHVNEKNEKTYVEGKISENEISFVTTQLGNYGLFTYNHKFEDVRDQYWAKEYIDILVSRHVITGNANNKFEPTKDITRAEVCTLLGKALGLEEQKGKSKFSDVKDKDWESGYINKLTELGIVGGYPNGEFNPDQTITREEMAVVIMKAYNYMKKTEGSDGERKTNFADYKEISSWALPSVKAAKELGILSGSSSNAFLPKQFASRGETAKMIVCLLQVGDYIPKN